MKKLFEVRLGGGSIHSGLLPVEALDLIKDVLAAMSEEGGDPEAWRRANPHVEVLGADSTLGAVHTEEFRELIGPAIRFVHKADQRNLGPKGLALIEKRFKPGQTWEFAELTVCDGHRPMVRFDTSYREAVQEERQPIRSIEELYARVVRVGGERPITAKLEIGTQSGTYKIASPELARKLAARLYDTAKVKAEVLWDPKTLDIISLTVIKVDEQWKDVHLGQVIEEHGGVLPIELSVESSDEVVAARNQSRKEH